MSPIDPFTAPSGRCDSSILSVFTTMSLDSINLSGSAFARPDAMYLSMTSILWLPIVDITQKPHLICVLMSLSMLFNAIIFSNTFPLSRNVVIVVHPATWYKVQFPDNSITTFRPSAFRIVGSDHDIEPFDLPANFSLSQPFLKSFKFTEKPAKPTRQRLSGNSTDLDAIDDEISVGDFESVATGTTATGHNEDASVSGASVPNDSQIKQKPLLLDNLDPDIWVGCTIKVSYKS